MFAPMSVILHKNKIDFSHASVIEIHLFFLKYITYNLELYITQKLLKNVWFLKIGKKILPFWFGIDKSNCAEIIPYWVLENIHKILVL